MLLGHVDTKKHRWTVLLIYNHFCNPVAPPIPYLCTG